MTAIKIIEENRKKIVDKLIKNMENGYIFSEWMWNKNALLPKNAITEKKYKGINKLNLSFAAMENNYNDPRWLTFKKIKESENNIVGSKYENTRVRLEIIKRI